MGSCERPEMKKLLYRHVRREVEDAGQRRQLEEHLQECAECRAIYQELEWMMGGLRTNTPEEHQELMRGLRSESQVSLPDDSGETEGADSGFLHRIKRWLSAGGGG
jgi:hypothetical protein